VTLEATVRVNVAGLPWRGFEALTVIPAGRAPNVQVTMPLNPFKGVSVSVYFAEVPPGRTDCAPDTATLKPGAVTTRLAFNE
jgi:hypothetical protein